jgi:hypothetical protein
MLEAIRIGLLGLVMLALLVTVLIRQKRLERLMEEKERQQYYENHVAQQRAEFLESEKRRLALDWRNFDSVGKRSLSENAKPTISQIFEGVPDEDNDDLRVLRHIPKNVTESLSTQDALQLASILTSLYKTRVGFVGGKEEIILLWTPSPRVMKRLWDMGLAYSEDSYGLGGVFPRRQSGAAWPEPSILPGPSLAGAKDDDSQKTALVYLN